MLAGSRSSGALRLEASQQFSGQVEGLGTIMNTKEHGKYDGTSSRGWVSGLLNSTPSHRTRKNN